MMASLLLVQILLSLVACAYLNSDDESGGLVNIDVTHHVKNVLCDDGMLKKGEARMSTSIHVSGDKGPQKSTGFQAINVSEDHPAGNVVNEIRGSEEVVIKNGNRFYPAGTSAADARAANVSSRAPAPSDDVKKKSGFFKDDFTDRCAQTVDPQRSRFGISIPDECIHDSLIGGSLEANRSGVETQNVRDAEKASTMSRSRCKECAYTVDMRCFHVYAGAFYHSIKDCLLPQYSLVAAARNYTGDQKRCAIAEGQMSKVLQALTEAMPLHIISPQNPCVDSMNKWSVDKSSLPGWKTPKEILNQQDKTTRMLKSDDVQALKAMQADALKTPTPKIGGAYIILIVRTGNSRKFLRETEDGLSKALKDAGVNFVKYWGNITQSETISLFSRASGVIGYHGAGSVNTLFSSRPQCVIEITTFQDADFSDNHIWRSNGILAKLNPNAKWSTYTIPLRRLIETNRYTLINNGDADHQIKDLQWVSLTVRDMESIVARMTSCMQTWK